ncbi:hypothetical protein GBAR_LOCUS25121, partial [Geodia barretti]
TCYSHSFPSSRRVHNPPVHLTIVSHGDIENRCVAHRPGVLTAEDVCKCFGSIYGCTYRLYNRNRKLARDRLVAEMTELNLRPVEKEEQTHPEEE